MYSTRADIYPSRENVRDRVPYSDRDTLINHYDTKHLYYRLQIFSVIAYAKK